MKLVRMMVLNYLIIKYGADAVLRHLKMIESKKFKNMRRRNWKKIKENWTEEA